MLLLSVIEIKNKINKLVIEMENKSFLKMSAKNCYGNRDLPNNEEHESPSIEPKVKLRTFVCPWKNLLVELCV